MAETPRFALKGGTATVIDKGQIVYCASIEDLRADDEIRPRYLAL